MKKSIVSFIIFALTILCIAFSLNHLTKICKDLSSTCMEMQYNINNENWSAANKLCDELSQTWDSHAVFLSSFSSEEELHSINDRLVSLKTYITLGNKEEAINYGNQVSFFLTHIKNMQRVNIENIF